MQSLFLIAIIAPRLSGMVFNRVLGRISKSSMIDWSSTSGAEFPVVLKDFVDKIDDYKQDQPMMPTGQFDIYDWF